MFAIHITRFLSLLLFGMLTVHAAKAQAPGFPAYDPDAPHYQVEITSEPSGQSLIILRPGPEFHHQCVTPCTVQVPLNIPFLYNIPYKGNDNILIIALEDPDQKDPIHIKLIPLITDEIRAEQRACSAQLKTYDMSVDKDAEPCSRVPPAMPQIAQNSGHCRMVFDVDRWGKPRNIRATLCTEAYYENAAIQTVRQWRYIPKIENGTFIAREGIETKVTFMLDDEMGNNIPERVLLSNEKDDWRAASKNWYKMD